METNIVSRESGGESNARRSAEEWLAQPEYRGLTILDPDGWDRRAEHWESSWGEKITRQEFDRRVCLSTIIAPLPEERNMGAAEARAFECDGYESWDNWRKQCCKLNMQLTLRPCRDKCYFAPSPNMKE